jgi:phosphatidylglycerophosphatase A
VRLWIAQGFGFGRIPFAPGTFGSFVGLAWFCLLVATGRFWVFLLGMILCVCLSVWLCGYAETLLRQKDPGSVVLDEIAAIPLCFVSWIAIHSWKTGLFPTVADFFSKKNWLPTLAVVAAFRLFDIWKPWPVRQSQHLPGGWGVTIDDLLAAIYVALVVLVIAIWRG